MATAAWRPPFPCIDAHVHLHPPRLASAIERHFARDGWVAAHPFEPAKVADTLAECGVERFCFFSYAHKPGMARELNEWIAATAAALPGAVGLGTLHADDPDQALGVRPPAISKLLEAALVLEALVHEQARVGARGVVRARRRDACGG